MINVVPEMYNRGVKYLAREDHKKALSFFKRQVDVFKELYLNMGSCYDAMNNDVKALECFMLAADHNTRFANGTCGPYPEALNNIGLIYYTRECDLLSIDYYTAAIDAKPDYYSARWHRSLSELRRYVSGWSDVNVDRAIIDYDFRFYVSKRPTEIDRSLPRWDGVTTGGSIIVLAEQGLGDNFQWLRYVRLLESKFDKVWVQIPTTLRGLHKHLNVVNMVQETDATVSVPLCSLTRYFDIDSIDCNYLTPPAAHDFNFSGLKIGIVGVGSTTHNNNYRRSCGLSYFLGLVGPAVRLYNLTPNSRDVKGIINLNPKTWSCTASYLMGLDLVISVDTSVVHLAGVLGVKCWVLMPLQESDWRWGDSSCGDNNVWYPTVKVIRNPNSWDVVFRNVKDRLNDFNCKS